MKKLLVKIKVIDQAYQPAIQFKPDRWIKDDIEVFEQPKLDDGSNDESYSYHPAVEAISEVLEQSHDEIIAQTQGTDEQLAQWLEGDKFKYPEGYWVEYVDISAEIEQQAKLQQAMDEIAKGIKGIAVFKVKVKEKQLSGQQIAQLFASEEIKKIIETLSTGSLPLASALINAYVADGVIVTEDDKQAVLAAIA